jgi:hypothetical protein
MLRSNKCHFSHCGNAFLRCNIHTGKWLPCTGNRHPAEVPDRRCLRTFRNPLRIGISPAVPWLQMASLTRYCIHVQFHACTYFWMASMSMSPASRAFRRACRGGPRYCPTTAPRPALLPTGGRERGLCLRDGPSARASPRRRARDATSSLPNDHAPGLLACTRAQSLRISLKAPPVGAANAILAPDIQQILEIAKSPLYPAA